MENMENNVVANEAAVEAANGLTFGQAVTSGLLKTLMVIGAGVVVKKIFGFGKSLIGKAKAAKQAAATIEAPDSVDETK